MTAVGVDGCRRGWIAMTRGSDGRTVGHLLDTIRDLCAAIPDATVVGIDIPLGFPTSGRRRTEEEARARLGPRRSSVFFTPPEAALREPTHAAATARCVELTGSGMSRQSYGLRDKIFEVQDWLATAPGCTVHEVHPELSFAALLGSPAAHSKKTWAGIVERRLALLDAHIDVEAIQPDVGAAAAPDDVLDAGAALWTATRIEAGAATTIPEDRRSAAEWGEPLIWT